MTAVNGVAELSKSPLSRDYGTVNSRLFVLDGGRLVAVPTIHPGKVIHLLGGSPGCPDRNWKDLRESPLEIRRHLYLDFILKPGVPVQLGGTGFWDGSDTVSREDMIHYLYAKHISAKAEIGQERSLGEEDDSSEDFGERREGTWVVPRCEYLTYRFNKYKTKKSFRWTEAVDRTKAEMDFRRGLFKSDVDRLVTKRSFRSKIKEEILLYRDAAQKGLVVLKNPVLSDYLVSMSGLVGSRRADDDFIPFVVPSESDKKLQDLALDELSGVPRVMTMSCFEASPAQFGVKSVSFLNRDRSFFNKTVAVLKRHGLVAARDVRLKKVIKPRGV